MFEKEWLPYALSIGVPYSDFGHMNPRRIKAFAKSHKNKRLMLDEQMWIGGIYTLSAINTAFADKKSKAKYIEKPLLQGIESPEDKAMTEEQRKELENQKLAMSLKIMQANWELNKK